MKLEGKVAIITGAAGGLGAAVAQTLARNGADCALCDIQTQPLTPLADEITSLGRRVRSYAVDVRLRSEVFSTVEKINEDFGSVDILVTTHGVSKILPFLEHTDDIWDMQIGVNLKGTFLFCQAVIPYMLEKHKGKIVTFSSQSGRKGNSHYAAYCASKFGIIGLTQSIAVEFAKEGINVNAVCPGIVFTKMWDTQIVDYAKKRNMKVEDVPAYLASKIPMGRAATPEEVASVVLFLVSDDSNYMTGQSINITGGSLM